jgi:DsbC/DsbD-like thiol-disulfide interchange protein
MRMIKDYRDFVAMQIQPMFATFTRTWLCVEPIASLGNIMVFRFPYKAALLASAFFYMPAHALESSWVEAGRAEVRMLADTSADNSIRAGIEIKLQPGWKTYWRYPGDAGVPPRFDWSGSENLAYAEVRWPAPEKFIDESGAKSIGYHDRVLFPVSIIAADPAQPVKLRLKIDFALCDKLCMPAEAQLGLNLPLQLGDLSESIQLAEASVPSRVPLGKKGELAITKVNVERGAKPRAIIDIAAPPDIAVQLFAEGPNEKWALPLPEKIEPVNGLTRFALDFDGAPPGSAAIPPKILLTLVAGNDAIEVEVPLE